MAQAEVAASHRFGDGATGSGRWGWCDTPHSGFVVSGTIAYNFEDGRDPLVIGPGKAFALPAAPRHRGINDGSDPARLFIIDALLGT